MTAIEFIRIFMMRVQTTKEWKAMENTVEGTQWHRERNVAIHTGMTLDHYVKTFAPERTQRQQLLSMLALLFHDFGKPATETLNEEGRHRYTGHEVVSSKIMLRFLDEQIELWQACLKMGILTSDLDALAYVIDHHLPYGKRTKKMLKLKVALQHFLGEDAVVYTDVLRSDSAGRISDNHAEKLQAVENWIAAYNALVIVPEEEILRLRAEKKAAWFAKHPELLQEKDSS